MDTLTHTIGFNLGKEDLECLADVELFLEDDCYQAWVAWTGDLDKITLTDYHSTKVIDSDKLREVNYDRVVEAINNIVGYMQKHELKQLHDDAYEASLDL